MTGFLAESGGEPRERLLTLFESRIYNKSFKDLSGWDMPVLSTPSPDISLHLAARDLRRYIFDRELPNDRLEEAKDRVATLTSLRERTDIKPSNLLLTPGASAALAVVLHFLRASYTEIILTDPPFYFSVSNLCRSLGMQFVAAPKSLDDLDDHHAILDLIKRHRWKRKAVILAHPRYVISRNYPGQLLSDIRNALNPEDFLIIDQSVDMEFCNEENFNVLGSNSIKVRTIGKALGLNGSRLALIVADEEYISKLNRHATILYGALDIAMLRLGALIAESPKEFERQLLALRKCVDSAFLEARLVLGSPVFTVVRPENGFLGYIVVDATQIGRFALYNALLRESVHAIFSAHVGLARSYHREMIRVNYLLDLRGGLMVLRELGERFS